MLLQKFKPETRWRHHNVNFRANCKLWDTQSLKECKQSYECSFLCRQIQLLHIDCDHHWSYHRTAPWIWQWYVFRDIILLAQCIELLVMAVRPSAHICSIRYSCSFLFRVWKCAWSCMARKIWRHARPVCWCVAMLWSFDCAAGRTHLFAVSCQVPQQALSQSSLQVSWEESCPWRLLRESSSTTVSTGWALSRRRYL